MKPTTPSLLLLLFLSCGDDEPEPYTWGDATEELASMYCQAMASPCGYTIDVPVCSRHNAWHLCEPDMSCDVEVDEVATREILDSCKKRLTNLDESECFVARAFGWAPPECLALLELDPGPQDPP